MYSCPVCGYDRLEQAPRDFAICPSCYTEFGYDDATRSHDELRKAWLRKGAPWEAGNVFPPPDGWNGYAQLLRAGLGYDFASRGDEPREVTIDLGTMVTRVGGAGSVVAHVTSRIVAVGSPVRLGISNSSPA